MFFQKRSTGLIKGMLIGAALGGIVSNGLMLASNKNMQKQVKKYANNAGHMMKSFWNSMGF